MNDLVTTIVGALAEQYAERFKACLGPIRLVGREMEFPLVESDGSAGDVRRLWPHLLSDGQFTQKYDDRETKSLIVALVGSDCVYEAEVGLGTIEVLVGPCEDLFQLEAASRRALTRLVHAAEREGLRVLGFGIQPRTRRSPRLMTPKQRYGALLDAIGKPWLHFCTTAADQLHVDISRAELLPMLNWMNLVSAPLIALLANSSVYAGRAGQFNSGREGLLGTIGQHRNGMTPRRFRSLADFMTFICTHPCYVLRQADGTLTPYNRPFTEYLDAHGADLDAYLLHEHYTWNSARTRVEHSTIEIRPACQQPPHELMAASALSLGFVEALPEVAGYFDGVFGDDAWDTMMRYRRAVVRVGMKAPEPAPGFLRKMVELAEDGLRTRGRGEQAFMAPIWDRLGKKRAPADEARATFGQHGMAALLDLLEIR